MLAIIASVPVIAGLEHSGSVIAGQPVPTYDLLMAAVAIAVWAAAIAWVAAGRRRRRQAAARAHIRSIRIALRDGGAFGRLLALPQRRSPRGARPVRQTPAAAAKIGQRNPARVEEFRIGVLTRHAGQ